MKRQTALGLRKMDKYIYAYTIIDLKCCTEYYASF